MNAFGRLKIFSCLYVEILYGMPVKEMETDSPVPMFGGQKWDDSTLTDHDTALFAETLSSILDLPSAATFIDEDPNANAAEKQTQRKYLRNFYRDLEFKEDIGLGAVFRVGRYVNRSNKRQYAVKHAIRSTMSRATGNRPTGGIFHALQEIRVTSHDALARHENIVRIFGWDVSVRREPVIIAEYASHGTLRNFLRADKMSKERLCSWNLKRNFALDVAAGLSAIHAADIAHGDIKLDNTLVFPHPKIERKWYAKVSDFSHSVLGISTKRITSYPGSGVYNAPGIRKREDHTTSDLLPSCETFSFGLLVWELLKDGESFLESGWLGQSGIPRTSDDPHSISKDMKIAWLETLPRNNLLDRAMAFLGTLTTMPRMTSSSFSLVFEHCLKDRSGMRAAMSTITSMLDYEDRAVILYRTTTFSIKPLAIWDFVPWATKHPWKLQEEIMQGYLEEVEDSIQPNHAEWYLLLARCYAEGFGTAISYSEMIECLRKSASHGSVESSFMLLCIESHFPTSTSKPVPVKNPIMVKGIPIFESPLTLAMQRIRKDRSLLPSPLQYVGIIQSWGKENSSFVQDQPFNLQGTTFFWKSAPDMMRFLDEVRSGPLSIWDIVIEFESLDSSLQAAGFFETCAAFGLEEWWCLAMNFAHDEQHISTPQKTVVFYNCLISALQSGEHFFIDIMETYADHTFFENLTNTVIEDRSNSPFHYLALYSRNDSELQSLTSKLLSYGFGQTINQTILKKVWLRPSGISLSGTPLHMAVRVRSLPAVKALMNAGAKPVEPCRVGGGSPLDLAIALNLPEIVQFMLDGILVTETIMESGNRALGKYPNKGVFELWMLHSADSLTNDIQKTIENLTHRRGNPRVDVEKVLLECLETGSKNTRKLDLLWSNLLDDTCNLNLSSHVVEKGMALTEQTIDDDPLNRDLLHFFFTNVVPRSSDKCTEIQDEALLIRWLQRGSISNIKDFVTKFRSEGWLSFLRDTNGETSRVVDTAISSGYITSFDFVMGYLPTECLTRTIDQGEKELVDRIIRSERGTIFCQLPTTTALHYATETSNIVMVQHLLSMTIPRTLPHIQFLRPMLHEPTREFQVFRWDPVLNMKDSSNANRTPLDIADDKNDSKIIEALLISDQYSDFAESSGQTMVALAVRNGHANLVKTLLLRKYTPHCFIEVAPEPTRGSVIPPPEWNFVFQSIYDTLRGDISLSTLERLLVLCKDKDIKSIEGRSAAEFWKNDRLWNGWLPIHYAIFCGHLGIFNVIHAAGIWSSNEGISKASNTGSLTLQMQIWENAFCYQELLEKNTVGQTETPVPENIVPEKSVPEKSTKNRIFRLIKLGNKREAEPHSPIPIILPITDPGIEGLINTPHYRFSHLWAPGKDSSYGLDEVHDLIWAGKTCLQMASDVLEWHHFLKLPYRKSQQRVVSQASRSAIHRELDKWTRQDKRTAVLSSSNRGDALTDLDQSLKKYINMVSDVGVPTPISLEMPKTTNSKVEDKGMSDLDEAISIPN